MLKQLLAAAVIVLWSCQAPVAAGEITVPEKAPEHTLIDATAVDAGAKVHLWEVVGRLPKPPYSFDADFRVTGERGSRITFTGPPGVYRVKLTRIFEDWKFTQSKAQVIIVEGDTKPNPPVPPLPSEVAGVLILEEQNDRTSAQRKIMDDPVWQSLCLLQGISYEIRDDNNPSVAKHLAAAGSERPVVLLIDGDDKVIETRAFPETVEAMRKLIGGVK